MSFIILLRVGGVKTTFKQDMRVTKNETVELMVELVNRPCTVTVNVVPPKVASFGVRTIVPVDDVMVSHDGIDEGVVIK